MGNQQDKMLHTNNDGINVMGADIRKKFAHGANINMKVVIRGERKSGKTQLLRRLRGQPFNENYEATPHINVAHINWDYKMRDDRVLVEVWDVVDKAMSSALPEEERGSPSNALADASNTDVYRACQCVIFMVDPRKKWTLDYVERELRKVPENVYILILSNFRDQHFDFKLTFDEVKEVAETFKSERPDAKLSVLECSMQNDFGLTAIINVFNLPFLRAKRRQLEQQLASLADEIEMAQQEHNVLMDGQSYKDYITRKEEMDRNRGSSRPQTSPAPGTSLEIHSARTDSTTATPTASPAPQPDAPIHTAISDKSSSVVDKYHEKSAEERSGGAKSGSSAPKATQAAKKSGPSFFARMKAKFKGPEDDIDPVERVRRQVEADLAAAAVKEVANQNVKSVEDFNAGELDDSFWGDDDAMSPREVGDESSEDAAATANPMAILSDEDLDGDENDWLNDTDEEEEKEEGEVVKEVEIPSLPKAPLNPMMLGDEDLDSLDGDGRSDLEEEETTTAVATENAAKKAVETETKAKSALNPMMLADEDIDSDDEKENEKEGETAKNASANADDVDDSHLWNMEITQEQVAKKAMMMVEDEDPFGDTDSESDEKKEESKETSASGAAAATAAARGRGARGRGGRGRGRGRGAGRGRGRGKGRGRAAKP